MTISIDQLKIVAAMTIKLTELRLINTPHLCIENFAPEMMAKLIAELPSEACDAPGKTDHYMDALHQRGNQSTIDAVKAKQDICAHDWGPWSSLHEDAHRRCMLCAALEMWTAKVGDQ